MSAPLKATVSLGLIAGLLLSPKLWLTARNYPLTPVLETLRPIPPPFDSMVFAAMLVLLVLIAVIPRARWLIAAFVLVAIGYALFDQSRWQPWFYQYLFMLIAIGLSKPDSAIQICRLIVASIYFWSGVQKFNPAFLDETFQWMVQPMVGSMPVGGLAFAAPVMESAIAIGLLTRRFRNAAVVVALAMHVFILASIGPFGHNHNRVVWPWNIAMGSLVIVLFWRKEFAVRDVVWGGKFQTVVLVLFAVMPMFSLFDLWDSYLSFALYSGNQRQATIYMDDAVVARLPEEVQEVVDVYESEFKVDTLAIEDWSFDELNVPVYAELRVFRNVGRRVCSDAGNSPLMVMVVEGRRQWFRRREMMMFTCERLRE